MQYVNMPITYAYATALEKEFGFIPKITLSESLRKFVEWYVDYYKPQNK